jgi:cell wall-associated NlpC family hydrolase
MGVPGYVPAKHYRLKPGDNFAKVAKLNDLGYQRLIEANPTIKPDKVREGVVILIPARLPKGITTTAVFSRLKKGSEGSMSFAGYKKPAPQNSKPAAKPVKPAPKLVAKPKPTSSAYYVRNGDNDWTIAPKFGITPKQLRQMNPRVNWDALHVGQPLRVPLHKAKAPAPKPTMSHAAAKKSGGVYKVKAGDNDWIIAKRLGLTPTQLRKMNPGVKWDSLHIGQSLKAPGGMTMASNPASGKVITSKRVAVNRTDVTVRSAPNTSARKVTIIDRGNVASVLDRKDGWYKLRFSTGLIGWVRGDMLKPVSAREAVASKPQRGSMSTASVSRPQTRGHASAPRQTVAYGKGAPSSLIGYAQTLMGVRYKWGSASVSRGGLDCSGFTSSVFAKHGIKIPRTSIEQSRFGQAVGKDSLKSGDLVFFATRGGSRVSHVGIYMGGGRFIHASSGGGKVQINSLSDSYYSRRYAGARRVSGGKSVTLAKEDPKPTAKPPAKVARTNEEGTKVATTETTPPVTQTTTTPPATGVAEAEVKKPDERPSRVQPGADLTGR